MADDTSSKNLTDDLNAVIFDLDGVLIDSEPLHAEAKQRAFAHFGLDVPASVHEQFKGQTDEDVLRHVAEHYAAEGRVPLEALIQRKREAFWALLDDLETVPGAESFVKAAARHYLLALCTSASQATREHAFDPLGWDDYFEAFVTAADVERPKPDPQPYRLAAERLGVAPERCLVVEDSLNGVRSARAAGCRVVGLTTSMTAGDLRDAGAHLVVDGFAELAAHLQLPLAANDAA